MALDPLINPNQTDAKSPIDQLLMDSIRENLENFDTRITLSAGADFSFRVNGNLNLLNLGSAPENGQNLDAAFIAQERTLGSASIYLGDSGAGGTLEVDVKRLKFLERPISGIENIFTANTQSIVRGSSQLSTQSITKSDADLATQSVTYNKTSEAVDNIIQVTGAFLFRYNLDTSSTTEGLDADYQVNDYVEISGCTDPNNNGVFQIVEVNQDNGRNIVIENLSGSAQTGSGGNIQLLQVAYTFLSSVPDNFAVGEDAVFNGHIDASNDGTFTILKTNDGGNNIIIKRTTALVPQAGAGGQVEVLRFSYNFLASVNTSFVVGEQAVFSGHTNAANDGSIEIKAVNYSGGNNIIVYNASGVLQPAAGGTVDTNRWVYALDLDPAGFFIVGDNAVFSGHTDAANDGTFTVVDVKYLATNNIVIYNASGVEQLLAGGTTDHAQKAITFREDFSGDFEIDKSTVVISNTPNGDNDGSFLVIDINRTSISPYNIICELSSGLLQAGDAGQINSEVRSIFTAGSASVNITQDKQVKTFTVTAGELGTDAIENDTIMLLDVLQAPANSANLAVNIK